VLVAARDLPPGHVLARTDLMRRAIPSDLVPGGVLHDVASAEGRTLSGGSRAGEPVTDVRLASPALTRLTTADDAHAAVPIRLADPAVADLLYPGRKVDVIAADTGPGRAAVLAERAPVIAIGPAEDRHSKGRLLIVGLPQQQAATVASAALTQSVTITLH
jgi:pilus assembly protein CpaB